MSASVQIVRDLAPQSVMKYGTAFSSKGSEAVSSIGRVHAQ
jgi:hypothetical protein